KTEYLLLAEKEYSAWTGLICQSITDAINEVMRKVNYRARVKNISLLQGAPYHHDSGIPKYHNLSPSGNELSHQSSVSSPRLPPHLIRRNCNPSQDQACSPTQLAVHHSSPSKSK